MRIELGVFFFRSEAWSRDMVAGTQTEVFEKIFGSERDEVIEQWRRMHNAELYYLCPSPSIIWVIRSRRMGWAGYVARIGSLRDEYRVLVGRPDRKIQLGRPRSRWKDNIKIDIEEVGWGGMDWFGLAQDRNSWRAIVNVVIKFGFPKMREIS